MLRQQGTRASRTPTTSTGTPPACAVMGHLQRPSPGVSTRAHHPARPLLSAEDWTVSPHGPCRAGDIQGELLWSPWEFPPSPPHPISSPLLPPPGQRTNLLPSSQTGRGRGLQEMAPVFRPDQGCLLSSQGALAGHEGDGPLNSTVTSPATQKITDCK